MNAPLDPSRLQNPPAAGRKVLLGAAVAYAIAMIALVAIHPSTNGLAEALINVMEIVVSVFAGWCCLHYAAEQRPDIIPDRTAWRLIGAGCLSWAAGQTLWTLYEVVLGQMVPYPGWPDLFFLASYPLALSGITRLLSRKDIFRQLRLVVDSIIAASSIGILSWYFVIRPLWNQDVPILERLLGGIYPFGDLAILFCASFLFHEAKVNRPLRLSTGMLAGGFILIALADTAFLYATLGDTYRTGTWADAAWSFGWALIGFAALYRLWYPVSEGVPHGEQMALNWLGTVGRAFFRVFAPYLAAVVALGLVLTAELHGGAISTTILVLGLIVTLLIIARQILSMLEIHHLNAQLRGLNDELKRHLVVRTTQMESLSAEMTEHRRTEAELTLHQEQLSEQVRTRTAELESAHLRIRMLIDTIPYGIQEMDRSGIITYCNPNHAKMLGYYPDELVGRSMLDLIAHDADRERTRRLLAELVRDRPTPWTLETQNRTKDGRVIWLRIDWNYRLNEAGDVVGFVSVLTDVTARKRAEAERQAIEAQIQQSQKLESLGVLAGGIAHDFNNLLMVVLGHAEMILTDRTLSEQARGNLADIEKAAQRASELCRQLLAYSGRSRFVIKPVDLNALIQELGRLLEVSIGKNAKVEYRLAEQLLPVLADATQIRQVVLNLLTNAAEAMPAADGRITVTTACRHVADAELEGMVLGQALEAGTYISFEVADTGCGMDSNTVARMFDPFFTTKFAGRGLGLAAVMGIVRSHGGAIACRSRPGAGTTIEVLLPALTGPYSSLSDTGPLGVRTWHGQGLVLLADDDPQVRTVSRQMLEKLGLQVIAAADGVEAVELFRARSGEFACVLLDLMMPRLSGEEVLQAIRQIAPAMPVILMSGYSEEETARRFDGQNRLWFLMKPFKIRNISNIFREFMPDATPPNTAT